MYNYPYGGIQWVVPAAPKFYSYWTNYYGLPVAGWNAGNNGGLDILIDQSIYNGYNDLTNQSVQVGRNLSLSKQEENCLQVAFPSTTSVKFCEKKEMLSFVVTPGDDFKNSTKGLLGTWNDNPDDDFTLHDGTVLSSSSTLREIHFRFGSKYVDECQSNSSNNCEQICVNLPASFFCDCGDGFQLTADGRSCDDINECEPTNDCMQKCVNTIGSYNCSCDDFFKPDPTDWRMCQGK
ncbi:hypothetical protein OS493_016737 [Desmophyllum pertusum]|uniref:VWFD domain-containing protein n=1 Tax=Desmophyllum pertusum TaxID=174260 RepID=A0A9W9Z0G6_9CNID|nr:hypothetical protein OS493_016737 [Desmophyllum pertusum]